MSVFSGLVLAVAMSTAVAAPADAYTYYRYAKPGKVVVLDQVQGTHYRQCVGYIVIGGISYPNCVWNPALIAPQNSISRSLATTSAQRVTVTWIVQRVGTNGWYTHAKRARVYTIPKGTSWITSEDWFTIPTKSLYMRMVVKINWKSVATGNSLGDYRAVFNQARDYRCVTQYPCKVMADSIWLKAPGT